MATNFPTGTDNFNVPSSPGSTALSASGSGSRNHVQHHRDLGDAIEAMEAQATLAIHSHDGITARHGNKLDQANTHESPDTDTASGSLHHTLGHGANQAAPGNHASLGSFQDTHANSVSWPVGCLYISSLSSNPTGLFGGTWVAIQDAFLIGTGGSYSYTGSVVNNASTHTHTVADTSADGSHTHTFPTPTDTQGSHGHNSSGNSGGTNVTHTHGTSASGTDSSYNSTAADSGDIPGSGSDGSSGHTHGVNNDPSYDPGNNLHTHSIGAYASAGGHSHTVGTVSGSTHSHTAATTSGNHLPPWKAFYMWRRTA